MYKKVSIIMITQIALALLQFLEFVLPILGYAVIKTLALIAKAISVYFQLLLIPEYTVPMLMIGFVFYTIRYYEPANRAAKNFCYELGGHVKSYAYNLLDFCVLSPLASLGHTITNAININIVIPCTVSYMAAANYTSETWANASDAVNNNIIDPCSMSYTVAANYTSESLDGLNEATKSAWNSCENFLGFNSIEG